MIRTTRTVVVASLALAALTGCGGAAAEAKGTHTYEPLPPLSTATPTTSPAPQPTSRPAPKSSPTPTAEVSSGGATDGGATVAGGAAVAGESAQAAPPVGNGMQLAPPGQEVSAGHVPAPVAGPVGGGVPVQATERTSTSTTTTTSTRLEAGLVLVITCEGLCMLSDLSTPELAGQDGPFTPARLEQVLQEELGGQGNDQQRLTDDLVAQLMKGQWALAERDLEGGDEKLVFSSARK